MRTYEIAHSRNAYPIAEVAEMLAVSGRTVERWIKNGDLAAFRVGRVVRVPAEELDRLRNQPAA